MPVSVEDLDFTGEWAVTDKQETFFHGCRDGVFTFTTEQNLNIQQKGRIKKMEDKFDAGDYTLIEYHSATSRWIGS